MNLQNALIKDIKQILQTAQNKAFTAVNFAMVEAYWQIGQRIVLEEQNGEHRAGYGTKLIQQLSIQLGKELGKGFSVVNLKSFRKFYLTFPTPEKGQTVSAQLQKAINQSNKKRHTASALSASSLSAICPDLLRKELTWSHYQLIMRVENREARNYYIKEAATNNWSVRTLNRNINTFYYERLLSSKVKPGESVINVSDKQSPADFIKDPYIFEFLNITQPHSNNELEIETALIDNLKHFLL